VEGGRRRDRQALFAWIAPSFILDPSSFILRDRP
jgi:hypothetical protein